MSSPENRQVIVLICPDVFKIVLWRIRRWYEYRGLTEGGGHTAAHVRGGWRGGGHVTPARGQPL